MNYQEVPSQLFSHIYHVTTGNEFIYIAKVSLVQIVKSTSFIFPFIFFIIHIQF